MGKAKRIVIIPIGPSIAYVPLANHLFALIDSDDAERVGKYNWFSKWSRYTRDYYVHRHITRAETEKRNAFQTLHRFIMPPPEGLTVDHRVPGNGRDCRKSNLRYATINDQVRNRRRPKNNTSGYKGVFRRGKRWQSYIHVNNKKIIIGNFSSAETAAAAYCEAATKLHGEFARFD